MHARYSRIRVPPKPVRSRCSLVIEQCRLEDDELDEHTESNSDYDFDATLSTGEDLTLSMKNSVFVINQLDYYESQFE